MEKYTRSSLARELHKQLLIPYSPTYALVVIMFERIKAALKRGQVVDIRQFGSFRVSEEAFQINHVFKHPELLGTKRKVKKIRFRSSPEIRRIVNDR